MSEIYYQLINEKKALETKIISMKKEMNDDMKPYESQLHEKDQEIQHILNTMIDTDFLAWVSDKNIVSNYMTNDMHCVIFAGRSGFKHIGLINDKFILTMQISYEYTPPRFDLYITPLTPEIIKNNYDIINREKGSTYATGTIISEFNDKTDSITKMNEPFLYSLFEYFANILHKYDNLMND